MSDIGFDGVAAFALGFLMIAFGVAGLVVEGVVAWRRRGRRHLLVFVLPTVYAALGAGVLSAAEAGSLDTKAAADRLAPIAALAGLVVWLGIRLILSRPTSAAPTGDRA